MLRACSSEKFLLIFQHSFLTCMGIKYTRTMDVVGTCIFHSVIQTISQGQVQHLLCKLRISCRPVKQGEENYEQFGLFGILLYSGMSCFSSC